MHPARVGAPEDLLCAMETPMPHRRTQPSTQTFQATPLDVIIDGIGRQRADAVRQNQALATLNSMPLPAPPAGPATLTLNGEVLDENTIPSVRDLGNLRDNPEIPQLIQDRFLVSDQAGQVRVLPEPGEDPRIAESFTPAMLALPEKLRTNWRWRSEALGNANSA